MQCSTQRESTPWIYPVEPQSFNVCQMLRPPQTWFSLFSFFSHSSLSYAFFCSTNKISRLMKDIDLRRQKEKDKPIWRKMISKNKSIIWTDENQRHFYIRKKPKKIQENLYQVRMMNFTENIELCQELLWLGVLHLLDSHILDKYRKNY